MNGVVQYGLLKIIVVEKNETKQKRRQRDTIRLCY